MTRGAAAILGALATHPRYAWMLRAYGRLPGLAPLLEWGYRRVARNRGLVSWLTRPWLPE